MWRTLGLTLAAITVCASVRPLPAIAAEPPTAAQLEFFEMRIRPEMKARNAGRFGTNSWIDLLGKALVDQIKIRPMHSFARPETCEKSALVGAIFQPSRNRVRDVA